ncbi:gp16 family protein [Psychrobacter sp. T6-1]|uniref:gp16 family protein n=1 Tax=Psychrobacter sp. T6-1 TaxID=3457447 RepID=UPI003FD41682
MSTKKALMAKIHIAKKELNLDDATYRDVLWRVTGKRSCKDMTIAQLQDAAKDMQNSGFKPKATPKHGSKPNVTKRRQPLINKIEAILADMGLHWNYAHGVGEQMFKIKRLQFLNDQQLYKVTQALSAHQQSETLKAAKEAAKPKQNAK